MKAISRTPDVIKLLCEEHQAIEDLMGIVEGCQGKRWTAMGIRLVDTPEWCRLYTLRCRVNDANTRALTIQSHEKSSNIMPVSVPKRE